MIWPIVAALGSGGLVGLSGVSLFYVTGLEWTKL